MKRLVISGLIIMLYVTNSVAQDAWKLQRKDSDSKVKLETVVSGYVADLNGKYKLRVTETTFKPGGYVGEHHHAVPGIRVITAGELTLVEAGKSTIYKAGDTFYEAGNVTNKAQNKGKIPAVLLVFEIIPVDWKGPTAIQPKSK